MRVELVTSAQNPKIKRLLLLQEKSRLRREEGLFVVEGRRELEHCLEGGFILDTIFYCPSIFGRGPLPLTTPRVAMSSGVSIPPEPASLTAGPIQEPAALLQRAQRVVEVTKELYRKIAYREGTEGILAEVRSKELSLEELELPEKPLVVVLEGVEKPGNLGAVLRSADAAGADAVIICDPQTDLWNPNLIRSSIGAVFTVPVVCCTSGEAIEFLKGRGVQILTAQLQDSSVYYDVDMTAATAIVIGTEATGLSGEWREAASRHVLIPMLGRLDSLNASVSAAILLYEAVRQRA